MSNAKQTSSVQELEGKPAFGSRFLTEDSEVWSQNAWDHVEPPAEQEAYVHSSLEKQRANPVPSADLAKYNEKPWRHWDNFYKTNTSNFFKDRKWLHLEFPELLEATGSDAGDVCILEVGCGAGNTVYPILSANSNPQLRIVACDYSHRAVTLVKSNSLYTSPHTGHISAHVWDLTSEELPEELIPESVDFIIMIFVLSALHPSEWRKAAANAHKVRFKGGRLLQDHFYIRGDKTRVYFFDLDDLARIFTGGSLPPSANIDIREDVEEQLGDSPAETPAEEPATLDAAADTTEEPIHDNHAAQIPHSPDRLLFVIDHIGVDRRLLVNRKRQLKMYRVWMQAKFRKIG